jgi:uncharacterized membrane protein HdeD (DUF308 family)
MTAAAVLPGVPATASALRRLYLARFAFAVGWALLLFATASTLGPLAVTLLVLYPLLDAGAAVVDTRVTRTAGAPVLLNLNIAISLVAAIGVGVAAGSDIPAVLRVWGAWAIVAGAIQLTVGMRRRTMGGQWPMIVSGGLSVLIGAAFIASAGADDPTLAGVAGYAVAGGVFFLVSALRLDSAAKRS